MKQRIYLFLLAMMAVSAIHAHSLTIGEAKVLRGGQAEVVVNYTSTAPLYGFQIETPLPTGISLGTVTPGSGLQAQGYTVSGSQLSSGKFRFLGYSAAHNAIPTGSGELFRFIVNASSTAATGTFAVTLGYVEFTNSQGQRELLSKPTFKITVYDPTELRNTMRSTLSAIDDALARLRALYDNTMALYEQLEGSLPDADYNQVIASLQAYDAPLAALLARRNALASQLASASTADYLALNESINTLYNDVSSFSSTMTVGIANLNETVKSMAANDLQQRLSSTGQLVSNLGNGCAQMLTDKLNLTAQTGNYYFERKATTAFNNVLATTNSKLNAYKNSVDSLTTVYNQLVNNNSIASVEDAISFYKKYFKLTDGYDKVSARTAGAQSSVDALQAAFDQLEVNFPDEELFFTVRPTGLSSEIQMGYKDKRGFVLTGGGLIMFEQVSGCDFVMFDEDENYVVASTGSTALTAGTEANATVWTGKSLGDGNYTFYSKTTGRYLAYGSSGLKVHSPITASATAHAWTIEETDLDPLKAFIIKLAEEEQDPKTGSNEEEVVIPGVEEICDDCSSRPTPIVFPDVPYPIKIKGGYLPIPMPTGNRVESVHPIRVPQGSHVILDGVTIRDYIGGHHAIYVEGLLEVYVNVVIEIRLWEWFIQVGPTGRVIWHYQGEDQRIKNQGELEMDGGKIELVDNSGTVNHKTGIINHIINRYVYNFVGGTIGKAYNYATMNHSGGTILTARNYADGTWRMTGGYVDNTVQNTTDTVFVNRGKFYFTGGIIRGWCSRLIYHDRGAFMRIDGGTFDFTHVRHYFIEAHDEFYIRGNYDYAATVPILLRPSVTIRVLYKWIYNFNIVFINGLPTPRYPLFRGEGFTLSTNHYQYISWTLPNHRWRWYYSVVNNTIEPRDEEVWDEDDLDAYIAWLTTYKDSEAASTETNPQVLDLGGRDIVITKPVVWPTGSHVLVKNGKFISNTTWTYEYMFRIPANSSVRLEGVTIDYSNRVHYVVSGSIVQRYIFDVTGYLYIGIGTVIKGYLDKSLPSTDSYIPGAAIRANGTGRIYLAGGLLTNVVLRLNSTVNVFITKALTSDVYFYLPVNCRNKGFRIAGAYGGYTIKQSDLYRLKIFGSNQWGFVIDTQGYVALSYLLGDVNDDGEVNVSDVMATVGYVLGNNPPIFIYRNANVNFDDGVNVADIMAIVSFIIN